MLDSRGQKTKCSRTRKDGQPCGAFAVNAPGATDILCSLHGGRSQGSSRCVCSRFPFPHTPSRTKCGKNLNIILVMTKTAGMASTSLGVTGLEAVAVPALPEPPLTPAPAKVWPEKPPDPLLIRKDRLVAITEEMARLQAERLNYLTPLSRMMACLDRINALGLERRTVEGELETLTHPPPTPAELEARLATLEAQLASLGERRKRAVEIEEHTALLDQINTLLPAILGLRQQLGKGLASPPTEPLKANYDFLDLITGQPHVREYPRKGDPQGLRAELPRPHTSQL